MKTEMANSDMIGAVDEALVALFRERAEAVSARVSDAVDDAEAERLIAVDRAAGSTGVARAARGIASTGTCVVVTDDEETRMETMLPETSVLLLRKADIVADLPDIASWLRSRQEEGRISYTSFITGPSRTADIERVGAIGVHGPLALHIILLEGGDHGKA